MCGRFAFIPNAKILKSQFQIEALELELPRYNIAPSSKVLFLCSDSEGGYHVLNLRWGLIPYWAKEFKSVGVLSNARAETLFEKPAFKLPACSKRGVLLMSGFYEWHTDEGKKRPYYIKSKSEQYLAIAALWDTWVSDKETLHSCCLVTTEANELMQSIHHRMPVILTPVNLEIWMDNSHYNPQNLISIMRPYEGDDLECYAVTPKMNKASFDEEEAIRPISRMGWDN